MTNKKRIIFLGILFILILGSIVVYKYNDKNNSKSMFEIGEYIEFGKYNNERILWRVINIDETGSPLLFMENVISIKSYDSVGTIHKDRDRIKYGSNYWENSNIRQWLNSENKVLQWIQNPPSSNNVFEGSNPYDKEPGFLSEDNFTEDEKKIIIAKKNKVLLAKMDEDRKTGGNKIFEHVDGLEDAIQNYDKAYYMEISDKVRLISIRELHDYVYKRSHNIWRKPTKQALEQNTEKGMNLATNDFCAYWLRDPDAESSFQAYTVYEDLSSFYGTYFGRQGIVASLNIDKNAISSSGLGDVNNPYLLNGKMRSIYFWEAN